MGRREQLVVHLVCRLLQHARVCNSYGTLVVPAWKSAPFWPLLCPDGHELGFASCVLEALVLPNRGDLIVPGRLGSVLPVDYCQVLAFRIAFLL